MPPLGERVALVENVLPLMENVMPLRKLLCPCGNCFAPLGERDAILENVLRLDYIYARIDEMIQWIIYIPYANTFSAFVQV